MKYNRILLKLSGEALLGKNSYGIDNDRLVVFAKEIEQIHVQGVEEQVVLREWYYDIPRLGKAAAFEKHMGLTLADFYQKFARFIQQPDPTVMAIFN